MSIRFSLLFSSVSLPAMSESIEISTEILFTNEVTTGRDRSQKRTKDARVGLLFGVEITKEALNSIADMGLRAADGVSWKQRLGRSKIQGSR